MQRERETLLTRLLGGGTERWMGVGECCRKMLPHAYNGRWMGVDERCRKVLPHAYNGTWHMAHGTVIRFPQLNSAWVHPYLEKQARGECRVKTRAGINQWRLCVLSYCVCCLYRIQYYACAHMQQ
jgi:hypothetical protein